MADNDWQSRIKTGRNDDCPCGSGKKYKKCHLQADEAAQSAAIAKVNAENAKNTKTDEQDQDHHDHSHPHAHQDRKHTGGHGPKPGSPVVHQVSAPRKAGGGS